MAHNKVILTGCIYPVYDDAATPGEWIIMENRKQLFWQGTLTNKETDVLWERIELPEERAPTIYIKLNDNLYFAGGSEVFEEEEIDSEKCHRYNLKEGKYYESTHALPLHLPPYFHIAAHDDGSFALLACLETSQLLTFTENEGFEEIPNSPLRNLNGREVLLKLK